MQTFSFSVSEEGLETANQSFSVLEITAIMPVFSLGLTSTAPPARLPAYENPYLPTNHQL